MGFAFNAGDKTTPREVFNSKLFLVILVASCGSIIFGYDLAFIGGVFSLPSFIDRFDLDGQDSSAIQAHMVNSCRLTTQSVSAVTHNIFSSRRRILWRHGGLRRE